MTELSTQARRSRQPAIRFDPRRNRGEADFERARKHSRLVRSLRFILPAIALAGVIGFGIAAWSVLGDARLLFSLKGLNLDTKSLTIDRPHVSGFKGTAQAYDVQAESAVQDLSNPKVVRLNKIDANFGFAENASAKLAAKTGVYDSGNEKLQLSEGITVVTTNGYHVTLDNADIDMKAGSLVSASPVVITAPTGRITGNHLTIGDRGKTIVLDNGVSVTYREAPPAAAAGTGESGAAGTP
jgi:lipopolysaccharide export system protein LptC